MAAKVNLDDTTLLLTRPETAALRFRAQVEAAPVLFAATLIAPLQEIVPLAIADPPRPGEEVVFTSENGVRALCGRGGTAQGGMAWCVGPRTADCARTAGFDVLRTCATAAELAAVLLREPAGAPLVHVAGRHRRSELAAGPGAAGRAFRTVVAYDQRQVPLSDAARALLQRPVDVLAPVFSPRSAGLLAQAAQGRRARLHVVAISEAAVREWQPVAGERLSIAASPNAAGVIAAINRLFDADRPA